MKKTIKRLAAFLMAGLLTGTALLGETAYAAEEPRDWTTVYQWTRVTDLSKLKDGPILLVWQSNNTYYCSSGLKGWISYGETNTVDWSGDQLKQLTHGDALPDSFFTEEKVQNHLSVKVMGENGEGLGVNITQWRNPKYSYFSEDYWLFSQNYTDTAEWTICGGGTMYEPGHMVEYGKVLIGKIRQGNTHSGYGTYIADILNHSTCYLTKTQGWENQFYLYSGESVTVHGIVSDTVIKSRTVVNYGSMRLAEGVTLTVEPEATLVIDGEFNNCGRIINYGTVIVKTGGAVFSSTYADDNTNGSFSNIGSGTYGGRPCEGSLVVEKGAALYMPISSGASFFAESDAVSVAGRLVLPMGMKLNNASLRVLSGGELITGYQYENLLVNNTTAFSVLNKPENICLLGRKTNYCNHFTGTCAVLTEYGGKFENGGGNVTGGSHTTIINAEKDEFI